MEFERGGLGILAFLSELEKERGLDLLPAPVFNTRSCLLLSASGCVERPRGPASAFRSNELHNTRCCSRACVRTTTETIGTALKRRLEPPHYD